MGTPAAEVDVDEELVRALLGEQHPDLADRRLVLTASGWDNLLWRLGDDLAVRIPRRAIAAPLVAHEQRWLPGLAPHLPLSIPAPVRVGVPGCGFPWRWSVVPWLDGADAWSAPPRDPIRAGEVLGGFLAALHRPAPDDAPANPYRGVPLVERQGRFSDALRALSQRDPGWAERCGTTDLDVVLRWEILAGAPEWSGPPLLLHGDLHPLNVVVHQGRVSAVIDFGDLTAGDPATDLAVAWMLLPAAARPAFRAAAGTGPGGLIDDATWCRSAAWALALAVAYLDGDGPVHAIGEATLATVMQEVADG